MHATFQLDKFDWLSNAEYCNLSVILWRNEKGVALVNMSMEQFDDFQKEIGHYSITNYRPALELIPPVFQQDGNGLLLNLKLMAKIKSQKALVHVYTLIAYGHFE
ncbi:hypothetical protein PVAND_004742 [Polypedilum vanderplanki]|uniref:Uncharacterized protein n=1 Tax=Polypedilum vanderplanki TaxID=319348 RepID=A0A9J6BYH8_POLVA|nr:hypothetical protein PVAND_004742 [Polypedilum vanderplanki]